MLLRCRTARHRHKPPAPRSCTHAAPALPAKADGSRPMWLRVRIGGVRLARPHRGGNVAPPTVFGGRRSWAKPWSGLLADDESRRRGGTALAWQDGSLRLHGGELRFE